MGWPLRWCWLTGIIQRKSKLSHIYLTEGSFTTWSQVPTESRFLNAHRAWELGALSTLIITFHSTGSQVLEKDSPGL